MSKPNYCLIPMVLSSHTLHTINCCLGGLVDVSEQERINALQEIATQCAAFKAARDERAGKG